MAASVQDLVDDLADALRRPVALEDRRWRLLAYSAHTELEDRVRQASILARAAPPRVAAWLDTLGLEAAADVVDTPPNAAIEMGPRTAAPVRHEGALLGVVWVIPGPRALDERERALLRETSRAAADVLWAERAGGGEAHARIAALLGELLDDPDPGVRTRAASELALRQGWSRSGAFALAVMDAPGDDDGAASEILERARRRWHADDLVWRVRGAVGTAVAHLGARGPDALAGALVDAGAAHAAASAVLPDLAAAREGVGGAAAALLALQHVPALGRSGSVDGLGAWPRVAALWDAAGRPAAPAPLPALLGAPRGSGVELVSALEAVLDCGGDVAAAARALHVHRATLYRRLARVQELTGLDLARGDDRLHAHLAVRMWRLAGSPDLG
jgi:hypothetical protein